jgi:signal transduction histidine kinase
MTGGVLVERLLSGDEHEAVTDLHEGRRPGAARLAAGVRRANGGAIVLSVDATAVADLQRQSSLDALLADIVRSTADVAYVVFDDGSVRRAQGTLPDDAGDRAPAGEPIERRLTVSGRPVLEIAGPIDIGGPATAHLTLGMRLDGLHSAESRTLARLVISLAAAATLGVLAVGFVWIRQRFGELSAKHALAQDALRRRDRLSAMGELASTVAHEIRNPLNAIAMSAQRLKKECLDIASNGAVADAGDARALVEVIQQESQRLDGKVQQFLQYARPPALDRRLVELAPWLDAIVSNVRPLAESRGVALGVEASAGTALLDPEQLRQAVDNLLLNAIEATPEGGRVSVRAAASPTEWTIEVRDTGGGIDPADVPRIFDLYFTTKATGTGVGLAVTQQIVAGHGGTVEVESAPGAGTVMRVRVPVVGEAAHA